MSTKKPKYIIALVHADIIEGVGPRGAIVQHSYEAQRYRSLKRALDVAQGWSWYPDVVRVVAVDE